MINHLAGLRLTDIDQSLSTLFDGLLMFPRLFAVQVEVLQLVLFMLDQVHLLVLGFRQGVLYGAKSSITSVMSLFALNLEEIIAGDDALTGSCFNKFNSLSACSFCSDNSLRLVISAASIASVINQTHQVDYSISIPHHRLDPRTSTFLKSSPNLSVNILFGPSNSTPSPSSSCAHQAAYASVKYSFSSRETTSPTFSAWRSCVDKVESGRMSGSVEV